MSKNSLLSSNLNDLPLSIVQLLGIPMEHQLQPLWKYRNFSRNLSMKVIQILIYQFVLLEVYRSKCQIII